MASNESHAYEIMRELDVDYVLVIFGGLISYSSDGKFILSLDILYMLHENIKFFFVNQSILTFSSIKDINKFLWMVRIGGSTEKGQHIKENHYYTPSGEFRVDAEGSSTLHNCLMYKLCYYRFGQLYTEGGKKINS